MAFGGLFGGSSATPVTATSVGNSGNPQIKDELKQQIAQELAVANATELVNKMTENCFEQCQKAPFANGEDVCITICMSECAHL
jgi:import inner membrane translocase subunit TIM13